MTIVRNIAYKQIEKMNKNIKEVIEVDNTLLTMIDINMKNTMTTLSTKAMSDIEKYNKLREQEILDLTNKYRSDKKETSVVKGIPIELLSKFRTYMKVMKKNVRFRYRGITTDLYDRPQSFCHLAGATSFAIYKK